MSADSETEITLATLPRDIVRSIIAIDDGESVAIMRYISQSWRSLVKEYLDRFPPIGGIALEGEEDEVMEIKILIDSHNVQHFAKQLKHFSLEDTTNDMSHYTHSSKSVDDMQVSLNFLNAIMRRAKYIRAFLFFDFNEEKLQTVRRALPRVKILYLEMLSYLSTDNRHYRRQLLDMVRFHSIEICALEDNVGKGQDLRNFLVALTESVSFVEIYGTCDDIPTNHGLDSPLFRLTEKEWKSIEKKFINSKKRSSASKSKIELKCFCGVFRRACCYSTPHFEFMNMFAELDF